VLTIQIKTHEGITAMSGADVIKAFIEAIETPDSDKARQYLSGDFVMSGWTAEPLNKYQFLDLIFALKKNQPDLAFQVYNLQEDNQLAQSDRVAADMQVTGIEASAMPSSASHISSSSEEGQGKLQHQEHVAFTVMGNTIESMIAAPVANDAFKNLIGQLKNVSPSNDDRPDQKQDNPRVTEEGYSEEKARNYNKQSNLYDPEGHTYTPSRDASYAPQVDAYSIAQQKQDNPATPLFDNAQEQSDLTRRQSDRQEE
jgi:hypothetical protein